MRRQQVLEAAERRRQEQENRGIKDIDKVRRAQQRKDDAERREEEVAKAGGGQGGLKVCVNYTVITKNQFSLFSQWQMD